MKIINTKTNRIIFYASFAIGVVICVFSSAFKIDGYIIDGSVMAPDGSIVRIKYEYKGRIISDSVSVKDNKIILKGSLPETVICTLSNSINQQLKVIVLGNEPVKLQGAMAKFYYMQVTGASQDVLFNQFKQKSIGLTGDYRKELELFKADFYDKTSKVYVRFHQRIDSLTSAFVKANPDATAASLAIINSHLNSTDYLKAENCYNLLSSKGKESYYAKRVKSFVDASKAIEIGNQAPNLKLKDIDGNTFDLSEHRGKYIFLDFWASWCKPCREEHPTLRKLNADYKNKNIMFVSVSMDTNSQSWRQAVADDALTWTQLHDPLAMNGSLAQAYSLKALPFNCVLDPTGKIIAVKLRGEALNNFLQTLFK